MPGYGSEARAAAMPIGTQTAEILTVEFDAAGRRVDADRTFAATYDLLAEICRDHPESAEYRNKAA